MKLNKKSAYILGFLWGDGAINRDRNKNCCSIIFSCQKADFDEVKLFLYSLVKKWTISCRKNKNYPQWKPLGIAISYDTKLRRFLIKNDFDKKSYISINKILKSIPSKYHEFWWRGLIDADGCWHISKNKGVRFYLSSSYTQNWKGHERFLKKLNVKYKIDKRIYKKSKGSNIRVDGIKNIIKLGNFVYRNDLKIGLKRKRNKFFLMKKNYETSTHGALKSSKVTGVAIDKVSKKWIAYINKNNKHYHLGYFVKEKDAISARKKAESE